MIHKDELDRMNRDVIDTLYEIEKKINKEKNEEKPDKAKIAQMRLEQFYKGLAMNTGIVRNNGYNRYF